MPPYRMRQCMDVGIPEHGPRRLLSAALRRESMRKIAKHVATAIALPLGASLILAAVLGVYWMDNVQRTSRVVLLADFAYSISSLISSLQQERSISAAHLSKVPGFQEMLPEARAQTDRGRRVFEQQAVADSSRSPSDAVLTQLRITRPALDDIEELRERVDQGSLTPIAAIQGYTLSIDRLQHLVTAIALDISVPALAEHFAAYQRLMVLGEYAARERSLGTALLGASGPDHLTYQQTFLDNMEAQAATMAELSKASPGTPDWTVFQTVSNAPGLEDLQTLRAQLIEPGNLAMPDVPAAMEWFHLTTVYIDHLTTALEQVAIDMSDQAQRLSRRANLQFAAVGAAVLLMLGDVAWVSTLIGRRLLWQMEAERRDAEQIRYLGQHDPLTGLPNRYYFQELLESERRAILEQGQMLALHMLDIVDFKGINRVWGIAAGDEVIREVARRLRSHLPSNGHLARLYGDQFAIVQPRIADQDEARLLAEALIAAFETPIMVDERTIRLEIRVGITLYPPNADTYDALVRSADLARQHVQGAGYNFYVSEMYQRYLKTKALVRDLKQAVSASEFLLVYQPKVALESGHLCGVEALIRWRHPQRGLLAPGEFMAEAERSGAILGIGSWVLDEACRQLQVWRSQGFQLPVVAINLSPVQLRQADLVHRISQALANARINPRHIEIEVTESAVIDDLEASLAILTEIRALGLTLAIDDFGTGYSSLTYLQRFPATSVKLDRSFIANLEWSQQAQRIVETVITLSQGLGLRVVAEGVESREQWELLRETGCDEVQGYLIAKPLAPEELTAWLKRA